MALPEYYENSAEYFESCLEFLNSFSWIYNVSNTKFLKKAVFNCFPDEWAKYFEDITNEDLNNFPENNNNKNKTPLSLKKFQQTLIALKPRKQFLNISISNVYFRKMNPKKLHEISKLSELVLSICEEDINILIDFGSGLGYLSEILCKNGKYKILGLECDEKRVEAANERKILYYPDSKDYVNYKTQFITESSRDFIINNLPLSDKSGCIGIVGLHSCADLTVTAMKLFFEIDNVKKLIIMPCCYHKMKLKDNNPNAFENFPLSQTLISVYEKYNESNIFNRPFLRLACQETNSRWKNQTELDHIKHSNEMFHRGLVEAILSDNEFVKKNKNYKELVKNFDDLSKRYELNSNNKLNSISWSKLHQSKFEEIIKKYPNGEKLSEALVCLQVGLQDLCENIVLYDRICFMNEQSRFLGIEINVRLEKILDDKISPRCNALIAEKIIIK